MRGASEVASTIVEGTPTGAGPGIDHEVNSAGDGRLEPGARGGGGGAVRVGARLGERDAHSPDDRAVELGARHAQGHGGSTLGRLRVLAGQQLGGTDHDREGARPEALGKTGRPGRDVPAKTLEVGEASATKSGSVWARSRRLMSKMRPCALGCPAWRPQQMP